MEKAALSPSGEAVVWEERSGAEVRLRFAALDPARPWSGVGAIMVGADWATGPNLSTAGFQTAFVNWLAWVDDSRVSVGSNVQQTVGDTRLSGRHWIVDALSGRVVPLEPLGILVPKGISDHAAPALWATDAAGSVHLVDPDTGHARRLPEAEAEAALERMAATSRADEMARIADAAFLGEAYGGAKISLLNSSVDGSRRLAWVESTLAPPYLVVASRAARRVWEIDRNQMASANLRMERVDFALPSGQRVRGQVFRPRIVRFHRMPVILDAAGLTDGELKEDHPVLRALVDAGFAVVRIEPRKVDDGSALPAERKDEHVRQLIALEEICARLELSNRAVALYGEGYAAGHALMMATRHAGRFRALILAGLVSNPTGANANWPKELELAIEARGTPVLLLASSGAGGLERTAEFNASRQAARGLRRHGFTPEVAGVPGALFTQHKPETAQEAARLATGFLARTVFVPSVKLGDLIVLGHLPD